MVNHTVRGRAMPTDYRPDFIDYLLARYGHILDELAEEFRAAGKPIDGRKGKDEFRVQVHHRVLNAWHRDHAH